MPLDGQREYTPGFVEAIQQQSNSLEYLRYMHRPVNRPPRGSPEYFSPSLSSALFKLRQSSPGLSTFHRLHTLDVDYRSDLVELLLDKALAPPNLRTLGLTGLGYDYELSWRHLPAFVSAMASGTPFSHLRLHTRPSGLDIADIPNIFSPPVWSNDNNDNPPLRNVLLDLGKTLDKRATVKLVCSFQARHLSNLQPPFLYGETMPDEVVMFDSEKLWSAEGDMDERFKVKEYTSEERELSGWRGSFSGLGNSSWKN
jgi:hypothetical protein